MAENKKLQIAAGEIRYLQTPSRNQDLVFIHGGFGDTSIFPLLESTFGRKYRITAPYLPWHGSFNPGKDFNYQNLVTALSEFLTKLRLTDYILMGHSLGGRLALDLSSCKGSRARGEVLLAPMLTPISTSLSQTAAHLLSDYTSDLGLIHKSYLQIETLPARVKNLRHIWKLVSSVGEIEKKTLTIPTTIIWGQDDSVLPFHKNAVAIPKVEGAKLKTYKGGHYWPFKRDSMKIINSLISQK